jgi:hypothetical protein
MHTKTLLVGVLAAASVVAAQEPHLIARDATETITAGEPTKTKHHHMDKDQALETEDPAKVSRYKADMKSLHSSIRVRFQSPFSALPETSQ